MPRIRDFGVTPGYLQPGPLNAITDVKGVRVGQATLNRDVDGIPWRTGYRPSGPMQVILCARASMPRPFLSTALAR